MALNLAWCVFILSIFCVRDSSALCYGDNPATSTCFPGPRDLAKIPQRTLSSTSTCGSPPSAYCNKLPLNGCYKCNATDPETMHPVIYMADASANTHWQSQTWWDWYQENPTEVLKVNVTVSFNKTYDITGQIVFTFKSQLPSQAVLEKSTDKGQSWVALHYFALNCKDAFDMEPRKDKVPPGVNDFNAYCTEKEPLELGTYILTTPEKDGIVKFDISTRFTLETLYNSTVQRYLSATDIRLRMVYPGTDSNEVISKDKATLQKYFYAISDTEINARCKCNGHARFCDFPNEKGKNCDCMHNTRGDDCELCLPLYNNRTWMPATSETQHNPCERCECHRHADSCTYSPVYKYGVCDNCKHNTTGHFCQQCKDKFYRNISLFIEDPKICPACNCFPQGITNNGTCNQTTGQCGCRANVTGRQCDLCDDTFWGYTLPPIGYCGECRCVGNGTVNGSLNCDQLTGKCSCKPNVHLTTCSECKHGFYSFPKTMEGDCRACDCDYGGSVLQICNKENADCMCRKNIQSERCTNALPGYFTPNFAYLKYEAERSPGSYQSTSNTVDLDRYFTGTGYGRLRQGEFINFRFTLSVTWKWYTVLRYTDLSPESDNLQIHITADATANCSAVNSTVLNVTAMRAGKGVAWKSASPLRICQGQEYNFNVSFATGASSNASVDVDSLILAPDVRDTRVYKIASAEGTANGFVVSTINQCWEDSTTLVLEKQSRAVCKNISFSVMAEVFDGALPCQCDIIGTVQNTTCDQYGGQCQCKPGVTGRTCNRCKPGFYDFTSLGCKPCSCVSNGSNHLVCDPVTGQCPCKPGVITRTCSRCNDSYYGYNTGQGCAECRCNASGSADMQCDGVTGKCPCKNSTDGQKCDRCRFAFYNFTSAGCQSCNCHEGGSRTLQCDLQTGICPCKTNAQGTKCDSCKNGTYNSDVNNPDGCAPCYGYGRSSTCTSAGGFVRSYITTDFATGINGWTFTPEGAGRMGPSQKSNGLEFTFSPLQNLTLEFNSSFNGDHLSSYGELVEFEIQHASQVALSAKWTLTLESKSKRRVKVRFPVEPTPSILVTSYHVRLHEAYAEQVITAHALQEVMADLFTVKLRGEFRSNGTFTLIRVRLHTAVRNGGDGVSVGNVENCTCDASNYTGLSCELCHQGYTRTVLRTPRFGSCELCRCTGRSSQCDGETGECRNCRTGSEGFFCQDCQPGVDNKTDCTQCFPEFWGLKPGSGGCKDCTCLLPNTLYGNNTVCNATTGQCTCKADISGRICDRCYENAYNTSRGCIDCPECYRLLQGHVHTLRRNITRLEELFIRVKNGDIGDVTFAELLSSSNATVLAMVGKAENNKTVEETLYQAIMALNNSLAAIERTLQADVTSGVTSLENITMATQQDRVGIMRLIQQTTDLVRFSSNLSATIEDAISRAQVTVAYLGGLVPSFASQAAMATAQADQQNKTGEDILNQTASAESLVTNAGSSSLATIARHNVTSQLSLDLKSLAESVRTLGTRTNTTAHALYRNVTAVLNAASQALRAVSALDPDNTAAVGEVEQAAAAARTNASAVIVKTSALVQQYSALVADTESAARNTEVIMAKVSQQEAAGKGTLAEAQRALAEAEAAVASASKTHQDALEMRKILLTFETKARESQRLAALALSRSREANQTSMKAIAYTQSINQSIQAALAIATQGLDMARQALGLAKSENEGVSLVHNLAKELKRNADSSPHTPDFMVSKRLNTTAISAKIERPIEACKTNYSSTSMAAKPVAEEALTLAQQSSGNTNTAKQAVDRVLGEIPRLQSVNTTRLAELQREIRRLRTQFTDLNVKTINAELRAAKDQQQLFVTQYKAQVQELRRQVDELKALQTSLGVPPKGCS